MLSGLVLCISELRPYGSPLARSGVDLVTIDEAMM